MTLDVAEALSNPLDMTLDVAEALSHPPDMTLDVAEALSNVKKQIQNKCKQRYCLAH